MNCLLYCIIYGLLSLSSRPSLETDCVLIRRKSRGRWRQSISIILFHCGYLVSHQAHSLHVSCSIASSICPVITAHCLPGVGAPQAAAATLGKFCFFLMTCLQLGSRENGTLMLPESDTVLKDPSYSCVQEHVLGKKSHSLKNRYTLPSVVEYQNTTIIAVKSCWLHAQICFFNTSSWWVQIRTVRRPFQHVLAWYSFTTFIVCSGSMSYSNTKLTKKQPSTWQLSGFLKNLETSLLCYSV